MAIDSDAVTREYRMDMQLHLYRRTHVENPAERYLIPLCQESKWYPARHPQDMVAVNLLPGSFITRCGSCGAAERRERAQGATR